MSKIFTSILKISYLGLASTLILTSCKKEPVVPGGGQESYINFYNASEALLQGRLTQENMVYINDSVSRAPFTRFPEFSENADDFRQFPSALLGSPNLGYDLAAPFELGYNRMFWLPVTSDTYRFIYTSINKVYLKDTTITLLPKTFSAQYLVESPEAEDAYRIVSTPIERKGIEGKVRIQVVNLSPSIENLEVIRVDESGNQIPTTLSTSLAFGNHSAYADIDTIGASRTRDQILLHFRKKGTSKILVTVAVPAISYSVFTLTCQGFEKETLRKVKVSNGQYEQITITPNLRVNKRRTL